MKKVSKGSKVKRFHMKMEDLKSKKQKLEDRIKELKGKENKTKRKTAYN